MSCQRWLTFRSDKARAVVFCNLRPVLGDCYYPQDPPQRAATPVHTREAVAA
jgi:hypothetical protein